MRRPFVLFILAIIAAACGSSSMSSTAPTQSTPQLAITPNPITVVAGSFSAFPGTPTHPFALSHLVIQYQGMTSVSMTVNTEHWKLVLTDGTVGLETTS